MATLREHLGAMAYYKIAVNALSQEETLNSLSHLAYRQQALEEADAIHEHALAMAERFMARVPVSLADVKLR